MFSIFAAKHVKQGRQFVKDARKLLAYKRDLWTAAHRGFVSLLEDEGVPYR